MLTFRKAVPADLDAIMTLVHEAQSFIATLGIDQWQDGYPSRDLIAEDIRIGRAYVVDDGVQARSVTILTDEPEPIYDQIADQWTVPGPYLTIHRMALSNALRHSGAANLILENAISLARELNLTSVRADTHRGNKAMRRFLEKNGFSERGLVEYEVDAGDPVRVAYELAI